MKPKISAEVEAMLRFFAKQSEISKHDIREFSKEYNLAQDITRKHNRATGVYRDER